MAELYEIVLTGGPCAGKTTALCRIENELRDKGFRVLSVPEVATRFIGGGISDIGEIAQKNPALYFEIQRNILRTHLDERKRYRGLGANFVKQGENLLIVYDRGAMDGSAYMTAESFQALLTDERLGLTDVRDDYDGIFHLVTAADGAEEFYTLANNQARKETPAQARELDQKVQQAWTGAPHLKVIGNGTDFEGKIKALEQSVHRILGIPVPLEIEKKYLLEEAPDLAKLASIFGPMRRVLIEQKYLVSDGNEELRIRERRADDGSSLHYLTTKVKLRPGVRNEKERRITAREYVDLSRMVDPTTVTIKKHRYCFVANQQYFELDVFVEPREGLSLLEIELTEENEGVTIPQGLSIAREVTDEADFSNRNIAKK